MAAEATCNSQETRNTARVHPSTDISVRRLSKVGRAEPRYDAPVSLPVGHRKSHCMVVHAYYPLGETRVQREAQALLNAGYDVHVICLQGQGEPRVDADEGVTITRLPVGRHRGHGFAVQLIEYLAFFLLAFLTVSVLHFRRRFATIQIHNLPDFLVFSAIVPKLMGTPIILDLHDLMPELLASRTGRSLDSWLVRVARFQEQLSCRFVNHVVTVSEGWRRTLISRGVPSHRVSVVMNVPDAQVFCPGQSADLSQTRRFNLLYHGTFTQRYGVDLIITAMALLRDELPDLHLKLLGDGETRQELIKLVHALGLQQRVTISDGMVGVDVLTDEIQKANVGIVPNRTNVFTDGILPTKLLEYVAMRIPVIAAKTPTVAEYFSDDMVEFFSPGDAKELADRIRVLHADPARRRTLVRNARAAFQEFNWDKSAARYVDLVHSQSAYQVPLHANKKKRGIVAVRRTRSPSAAVAAEKKPGEIAFESSHCAEHQAWDQFLSTTPMGHHTQTSLWSQVRASQGWLAIRVVGSREGRIVGGAQILYKSFPPLGRIGYITKGPVLEAGEPELAGMLMKEIEHTLRAHKIRLLTVQPPGTIPDRPDYLEGPRFIESIAEIAPRATLLMDVRPAADEIMAGIKPGTRYNIRLSGRKGVVVREGGDHDLAIFHKILVATAARKNFRAYPLEYFVEMWNILHARGSLRLSLAEIDGEVVAAQIAIPFGDTVVNKLSVWTGRHGNCRPNEALQWSTILWAHEHGYAVYDLEGIKLSAAQALLEGKQRPTSPSHSVTSFKLGFCDHVVIGPSAQIYVPNRFLRWGFRQLYPHLNGRRWAKSLVKRIRTESNKDSRRT